jgi:ribosomal protein L37E
MKIWHIECSECGFRQRAIQDPKPKRKCPNRHTTCTNSHLDLVHEIEHLNQWYDFSREEKTDDGSHFGKYTNYTIVPVWGFVDGHLVMIGKRKRYHLQECCGKNRFNSRCPVCGYNWKSEKQIPITYPPTKIDEDGDLYYTISGEE